jgi:hypothetical protein
MKVLSLCAAAACAGAARAEGDALRAQLAASLSAAAPSFCATSAAGSCPSAAYSVVSVGSSKVCCLGSPFINSCSSFAGTLAGGSLICGSVTVSCNRLSALSDCTGTAQQSAPAAPVNGICPSVSSNTEAGQVCASLGGTTLSLIPVGVFGCGTYSCLPQGCVGGLVRPPGQSCSPGNVNVPAIFLAMLGALAATIL